MAFVRARELPKGALVEYQTCLHTGRQGAEEQKAAEDADNDADLEAEYAIGGSDDVWWEQCVTVGIARKTSKATVFGKSALSLFMSSTPTWLHWPGADW